MSILQAGFARCKITPPIGTPLLGYAGSRVGTTVADDLWVSALVLNSGETTAALVSIDVCVIEEGDANVMRAAVTQATGIAAQNVLLSAIHTHSGPVTVTLWGWGDKNATYLEWVQRQIVESVSAAQAALEPVRVGIGVTMTDTGVNRREVTPEGDVILGFHEWGALDRHLTVVRFEGLTGPVAQIVNLAAHPTARGSDPAISRDWPGVMADRVENVTGTPVLFINGAFGDTAPRTTCGGSPGDGAVAALEVGLRAANDAVRCWESIKEFRTLQVQTLAAEIYLTHASRPSVEEVTRELEERQEAPEPTAGAVYTEWRYWNAVRESYALPRQENRVFGQTLLRLGPLVIVPFPGEPFAEIMLRLRKASPFAHTLCAGVTNGCQGYYPTREARARGGYETWVGRGFGPYLLADDIDDVLVSENLRLLRAFQPSHVASE